MSFNSGAPHRRPSVLFLLPWLALVGWYSLPIVLHSLFEMEKFAETYIPGYFILKLQLFFLAVVEFGFGCFACELQEDLASPMSRRSS
jgi:hypothetical protein